MSAVGRHGAVQNGAVRHSAAPALVAVGAAAVVGALTGCASIEDSLQHQVRATYSDGAALAKAWPSKAAQPRWIPADASNVRLIAGTAGTSAANSPAAVRVDGRGALPADCRSVQRRSMDPFAESWSPQGAVPTRIERCGDWAVIPVDGGWYGWTPLAPEELTE